MKPPKKANPGADFERKMAGTFAVYERRGIATMRKVDPPTRTIYAGKGPVKRAMVIQLESIYLDFTGAWTEYGGQMLMVECKSTAEPRLCIRLNDEGAGIKWKQVQSAARWEASGAAVCFLWEHQGEVRLLTTWKILALVREGKKSIPWHSAFRIPQDRFVVDFLPLLSILTSKPEPATAPECEMKNEAGDSLSRCATTAASQAGSPSLSGTCTADAQRLAAT